MAIEYQHCCNSLDQVPEGATLISIDDVPVLGCCEGCKKPIMENEKHADYEDGVLLCSKCFAEDNPQYSRSDNTSPLYKAGDILKYTDGPTAILLVTYVSENHGGTNIHRYYGTHYYGGSAGCYEKDASLLSIDELPEDEIAADWVKKILAERTQS